MSTACIIVDMITADQYIDLHKQFIRFLQKRGHTDPEGLAGDALEKSLRAGYHRLPYDEFLTVSYTILKRLLINSYRRKSVEQKYVGHVATADFCTDSEPPNFKVDEALELLPQKYREIMRLRFVEDLALQEVADIVGYSYTTVRKMVCEAYAMLRPHLAALA